MVDVDINAPAVKDVPEFVYYYDEKLPSIRFQAPDEAPDGVRGRVTFQLSPMQGNSVEEPMKGDFQIDQEEGQDDFWVLKFPNDKRIADGEHKFRLMATDRANNRGHCDFTVIADHKPPEITISSPARDALFTRGETLELVARVSDDVSSGQDGLNVAAWIAIESPKPDRPGHSCAKSRRSRAVGSIILRTFFECSRKQVHAEISPSRMSKARPSGRQEFLFTISNRTPFMSRTQGLK
jgi:hypothetical protein